MNFINTYEDAVNLTDAATHLANILHRSPAYPGALHPFTVSIDGVNVDGENAAREAFFSFLCSILNRWYDGFPARQVPSLQIRVSVLRNNLTTILLRAPRPGVAVFWGNGEFEVNPKVARVSALLCAHAPCIILDAGGLRIKTGKEE